MKRLLVALAFLSALSVCLMQKTYADIIYFKNGRSIEGIVKEEAPNTIEIDVGFGTITCSRDQVKKVTRSTAEESAAINERWEAKREELKEKEQEYDRAREKRFSDYEQWVREERKRRKEEAGGGVRDILVRRDLDTNSVLVDVLLNGKVNATLVLDTGASVVVISKKVGEALGINLQEKKGDIVALRLAGNRKVDARMVVLKSVRIKDVEVKDVLTAVMTEDFVDAGFKDGLLGMTFLNKFNLKIDLKDMKMSLEKLKN